MSDFTNQFINNKVDRTNKTIINRGRGIVQGNRIKLQSLDIENQIAKFSALGTKKYTVTIRNFLSKSISTYCNCPFDWGPTCKHEIGGLLFLADAIDEGKLEKLQNAATEQNSPPPLKKTKSAIKKVALKQDQKPKPKPIPLHKSNMPYEIEDYENLTTRKLTSAMARQNINTYSLPGKISIDELNRNEIIFEVASRKWWEKYESVSFFLHNDKLYTKCTCGKEVKQFCIHQFASLYSILYEDNLHLFSFFKTDTQKVLLEELMQRYRLPEEEILKNFAPGIDNGVIGFYPKPGAFISFSDKSSKKEISSVFSAIKKDKKKSFFRNAGKILDEWKIGFVINNTPEDVALIPIKGQISKIGDLKNIKAISPIEMDDDAFNFTTQKQSNIILNAFLLNEDYKRHVDYHEEDKMVISQATFNTWVDLFNQILDEKYLFYRYDYLKARDKIKKKDLEPVRLSAKRASLVFELTEEDYYYVLKAKIYTDDELLLDLSTIKTEKLFSILPTAMVWHNDSLMLLENYDQCLTIDLFAKEKPIIKTPKPEFDQLFEQLIVPLAAKHKIIMGDLTEFGVFHIDMLPQKRQVFLSEFDNFLLLKPIVEYDNDTQALILNDEAFIKKEGDKIIVKQRDTAYENAFAEIMRNLHPSFLKQFHDEYFYLPIKDVMKGNWFFDTFETLREQEVEIFGLKDLKGIKFSPHKGNFSIGISSGEDWFDVNIEVSYGDEKIKLSALRKAILRKEKYIKLSDGKLGVLPEEWIEKLSKYFRAGEVKDNELKISKLKFHIIDELFKEIDLTEIMKEIAEKKAKLKAFKTMKKVRVPKEIKGSLRDYQKEGLNWLNFLDEFKWGGILADDMGLGKTIQILSFLQLQKNKSKKANLVVVPTSLLFNWENEIQKFLPSLNYVIHHGQGRKTKYTDFKNYDLIITTYGIMAIDIEIFRKYKFNYIILDESQAIKNIGSLRYKAALLLRGQNRLTMTGTPIENNTFDLYAQMNFINQGFLGSQKDFKDLYSTPIDRDRDSQRAAELQQLINPFLLRRTKEQVATELPPKIEDVLICNMGDEQRKVYEAFKNKYRNYLMGKIDELGINKSKMYVLEGLMKLRQICDSPLLLNEEESYTSQAIKIKVLMEHIQEKNDHHKILIFSQFVSMLTLIRKELEKNDILYEYLDGKNSKKQRQASVERFQDDDNYRVFLISLKAGGTGLNLTAADYVYIVDPWWNPAVETQAIDRAHRIGQDKHVIAYRMICKDTIEEKIVNLQKKKTQIASELIKTEESFMKKITTDDIASLFE